MADGEKPGRSAAERRAILRDVLVVLLALTGGAVNAVSFLRVGKVFTSVLTGNLALLGIAAGHHEGSLAANGGVAIAGYGLGVLAGTAMASTRGHGAGGNGAPGNGEQVWPWRTTLTLTAELVVLAGFSAGWLADTHPAGAAELVLLVVAAAAMGMQSAAVRSLGSMSSTYLTSTTIGLLEALALRRRPEHWQRGTGVLVALAVGAALGAWALTIPALAVVAMLLPLGVVVACSVTVAGPVARERLADREDPVPPAPQSADEHGPEGRPGIPGSCDAVELEPRPSDGGPKRMH